MFTIKQDILSGNWHVTRKVDGLFYFGSASKAECKEWVKRNTPRFTDVGVETINGDPDTAIKLSFQVRVF